MHTVPCAKKEEGHGPLPRLSLLIMPVKCAKSAGHCSTADAPSAAIVCSDASAAMK